MTTKTRMNRDMRIRLIQLAREKIFSVNVVPELRVAHAKAERMLLRVIKEQYPPKHMAILKEYGCIRDLNQFQLLIVENGTPRYASWSFDGMNKEDVPLQPYAPYGTKHIRIEKPDDLKILNDYLSGHAAHEKVQQEKYEVFRKLIDNARYLEQIVEVWPDARKVCSTIPALPAIQLAPLMDQVRDIVERKYA